MATRTGTALVCAWLLAAGCADHAAEAAEPDAVSSERADADGGEVGAGEAAVARDGGVTIHRPPPPPISGGHMLVHEDLVWVADSARDRLTVARVALEPSPDISVLAEWALPAGSDPQRMSVDDAGQLFVALRATGQIARVRLDTRELELVGVCEAPRGLAWDPARERTWLACAGGELLALDRRGRIALRRSLHPDLRDVVFDDRGELYVSVFRSAEVLRLDESLAVVERWRAPTYERPAPRTSRDSPITNERFVPNTAWRMRARPGGGVEVLHQASRVVGEPLPIFSSPYGSWGLGSTCHRSLVLTALSAFVPDEAPLRVGTLGQVALGVDFSRVGDAVAIASAGQQPRAGVAIVRSAPISTDPADAGPLEEPCVATRTRIDPSGPATALEPLGESWIAFASRAASLTLVDADGIERRRVWLDAARGSDVGHALFHDVPSSGVACASCHPEGRDDGLTWDFGEGPRRTHSLVGGISSTAPFHWRGEIRSLAQVMTDTFERQMGGHRVSDAEVDALGAWLDALPAIATASDAAAATRGAEVFDQAGCAVCHAGPLGTRREAAVVDAEMLQVPLLTGVGLRAPYLHDGCAPTLHAVLVGCAGRAPHPGVEALHEAEREDLIAFLARWR